MRIELTSADRLRWMALIGDAKRNVVAESPDEVTICVAETDACCRLKPEHITSLACLIETCKLNGVGCVRMNVSGALKEQLESVLHITSYWKTKEEYVNPDSDAYLNLWKVNPEGIDFHAKRIEDYFRKGGFKHKDLSPLSQSLLEALYNVIDHAKCQGVAYTFAECQNDERKVNVAVCDFGRGIVGSVRTKFPELKDVEALEKALEPKFTIGSTKHNAGFGLSILRSCCTNPDSLWILSNGAAVVTDGDSQRFIALEKPFDGTLIFYTISLDHLEDEDIEDRVTDLSI